jgi:hypothetical protein
VIIELTIDRLVLDGLPFPASTGAAVGAALELELGRLFATRDLGGLQSNRALPRLDAADLQMPKRVRPAQIGAGIARSVHEGLVR